MQLSKVMMQVIHYGIGFQGLDFVGTLWGLDESHGA